MDKVVLLFKVAFGFFLVFLPLWGAIALEWFWNSWMKGGHK